MHYVTSLVIQTCHVDRSKQSRYRIASPGGLGTLIGDVKAEARITACRIVSSQVVEAR